MLYDTISEYLKIIYVNDTSKKDDVKVTEEQVEDIVDERLVNKMVDCYLYVSEVETIILITDKIENLSKRKSYKYITIIMTLKNLDSNWILGSYIPRINASFIHSFTFINLRKISP